jgi:integrase
MPATGDRITKRKDGLFQGMYTAQTPDGPKRKYVYGRKYGEVQKKLAEAMGDVARGIVFDDKNLTVGEYLDHFLEDVQRGSVREARRPGYTIRASLDVRKIPRFAGIF